MLLPATLRRGPAVLFFFSCILFFLPCLFIINLNYPLRVVNPLAHFGTKEEPITSTTELDREQPLVSEYTDIQNSTLSREKFIEISSHVEIPLFNHTEIQTMCSEGPWPKDLVFECADAVGGLNNVRQQILSCVRWAIEFKAAIVFPSIRPRLETNASESVVHEYSSPGALDVLFDHKKFIGRLHKGCPQMVVYENASSIAKPGQIKQVRTIQIPRGSTNEEVQAFKTNWTLENKGVDGKVRLAKVRRMATEYDVCNDGVGFANSLGQILTMRDDTYRLAAATLYELSRRYSLSLEPAQNFNTNGFLGIHLRTSADAVNVKWMSYEDQAAMYQKLAKEYALPVIYVASGNLSSTQIFAETVFPTPVVTKSSLLSGEELALLKSLTWDQQAQVDYLVLIRASRYLGMSDSNFSWAVAVARRAAGNIGTCGVIGEEKLKTEKSIALKDELSIIIGKPSKYHFGTRSWP